MRFSFCCRIFLKRADLRVISELSVKFVLTFTTRLIFFLLFAPPSPQVRLDHRGQVSAHFSLSTCTFLQDNMVHFHLQNLSLLFYLPAICQELGYYQSPSPRPGFHILRTTFAHIEPLLFQMVFGQKQHLRLPT